MEHFGQGQISEVKPGTQAVELVDKHGYLTKEMKAELPNIALTNVSRFLGTPVQDGP